MKNTDEITLEGFVTLKFIDRNGNIFREESGSNLIVLGGRNAMAKCLGSLVDGAAAPAIRYIAFGNQPSPVVGANDTALQNQVFQKELDAECTTYDNQGSVVFNWLLDYSEGNGYDITEMGLKTTLGNLFSRIIRNVPISKTSDFAINGYWRIKA